MQNRELQEYEFKSKDEKLTIKLEFYQDSINDIKVKVFGFEGDRMDDYFTYEEIEKLNKKLSKYVNKQNKLKAEFNLKNKESNCNHRNARSSHPYGDLWCPDCFLI